MIRLKYDSHDASLGIKRQILCISKNSKEIYYQFEDESAESAPTTAADSASTPSAPVAAAAPVAQVVAAPSPSAGPAASIPDEPLKAVDTLRVIIAQKLKKSVGEVPLSKTIKDLVGGKSTLQNEIIGDLQAEFGSPPEKGEELPLSELGAALGQNYNGTLGKHTAALVSRMIGSKMPGGFGLSAAKAHLAKTWGLGSGRVDAVLLIGLTQEPAKRLGGEADAKAWLDSTAQAYAQGAGISLSSGGSGGGGGGGGGTGAGMMIDSEQLDKMQAKQDDFVSQQVEVLMRYLGRDARTGHRMADAQKVDTGALQDRLDAINREHGDDYIQGIQPIFEPLKARHFNSSWNWVRQDALSMWMDILYVFALFPSPPYLLPLLLCPLVPFPFPDIKRSFFQIRTSHHGRS